MKQKAKNTFNEGVVADTSAYKTSPNALTDCVNMRRLSTGHNQYVLQPVEGAEKVIDLPTGFMVVGSTVFDKVAYLVLRHTDGTVELGSFPSPAVATTGATGLLDYTYRPFVNFKADGLTLGPFRTKGWNLPAGVPVMVEAQASYDGTVNLALFGDSIQPLLVNSRFAARGGRYEIIERQGVEANVYTEASFGDTLNFIQRADKLLNIRFDGVLAGGALESGNYRVFFRYATSDGNVTDIAAETMTCSVFHGNKLSNVRAGKPGEKTDKRIALSLSNIDTSFPYLEVLYTRASGTDSVVVNTYQLQTRVPVTGAAMTFFLTGFEQTIEVATELLSTTFASIESFKAGAQVHNRFFPANTKETQRNYPLLQEFARAVTLGAVQQYLPVATGASGLGALYETDVLDVNPVSGGSWRGGYASPMNIYHRMGEWGGEAVPYAISFIFKDNSLSPAIPVTGIDNVNNTRAAYADDPEFEAKLQSAIDLFNGYDPETGLNVRGVYRFPNRNATGTESVLAQERFVNAMGSGTTTNEIGRQNVVDPSPELRDYETQGWVRDVSTAAIRTKGTANEFEEAYLGDYYGIDPTPDPEAAYTYFIDVTLSETTSANDEWGNPAGTTYILGDPALCVNGITFKFPALGADLFNRIEAETIGCVLLRGERHADVLAQGWLVPALEVLKADDAYYNHTQNSYFDSPSKVKYVPAFRGGIEGQDRTGATKGINPAYFGPSLYVNGVSRRILPNDRYCLLTADMIANEKGGGQLLDADTERSMKVLGVARTYLTGTIDCEHAVAKDQFTVAMATQVKSTFVAPVKVRTAYTLGGQSAFNRLGFSSKLQNLEARISSSSYIRCWTAFNSYIGVKLSDTTLEGDTGEGYLYENTATGDSNTVAAARGASNKEVAAAYVANIYSGLAQRTTAQVGDVYSNVNAIRYRPISQRLYWRKDKGGASVEGLLDSDNRVRAFGGDCFVSMPLRNMFFNPITKDDTDLVSDEPTNIASIVQLCHESNLNGQLREPDTTQTAERFTLGQERSFAPLMSQFSEATLRDPKKNGLRRQRVLETGLGNLGHSDMASRKIVVALPQHVPYIATRFDTRVYFSDPHITGSFVNGYRNILPTAHRDYARHMGQIVRLITQGDGLYALFERGVAYLPVLERVQTARDGAGAIFIAPNEVLGERMGIRTAFYGVQTPTAAVATDNHVYGIDLNECKIWRTEGEDVRAISDDFIESFLLEIIGTYRGNVLEVGTLEVAAFYDRAHREVLFSFFAAAAPDKCRLFVFNEKHSQWEGRHLFNPTQYLSLSRDEVYSVPATQGSIWKHHVETKLASFYGSQPVYEYEFVVGTDEEGNEPVQRIFDNFELACNGVMPEVIIYRNDKITAEQPIVHTGNIFKNNAKRREDVIYIQINRLTEARVRDRYVRVRIRYTSTQRALVHSVVTSFRVSAN